MAHRLMIFGQGDDRRVVEIAGRSADGAFRVTVDGAAFEVRVEPLEDAVFRVRVGERTFILYGVADGADLHFFWNGRAYRLRRETGRPSRAQSGEIEAEVPGRVTLVHTRPGQEVAMGDPLLVIEAMKMESVLRAPKGGRIRTVHVKPGDLVDAGRVLVEMD
jgi:biotin carboxyl carrier protein